MINNFQGTISALRGYLKKVKVMLTIQQQLEPQMPTVVWCPNVFRFQIASERI